MQQVIAPREVHCSAYCHSAGAGLVIVSSIIDGGLGPM